MKLIAMAGGIGSGKSVLSRMMVTMGYSVYDTDREARRLMNDNQSLRERLVSVFGSEVFRPDGTVNRPKLASLVFCNEEALKRLNAIVHPAVAADLTLWAQAIQAQVAFVETALINTGGIRSLVQGVWMVEAPVPLRCSRVMARNGLSQADVLQRISRQVADERPSAHDVCIVNDDCHALLPQVVQALSQL